MADPGVDQGALSVVPCPDCGRNVPSGGGCDFYRWEEAYAAHVATLGLGGATPVVGQVGPGSTMFTTFDLGRFIVQVGFFVTSVTVTYFRLRKW
ncbi:hypothetical protein CFC21_096757 [Triticum aestivum]|uniref:Uncharacterized protein n=4 Tax=Triticum TaxID=4564 RepID=A0A9R0Z656_TRITD|nr:hypothetical protein TRIUR3_03223 [Triticum urartu]KAF7094449.1 hypothetical protein CFC21_096757 [Triticum aestivum]VAI72051.1 unnamed protein product [Triticum turgidum subsp. durum]